MRPFGAKSVHWFRSYKLFSEEVKFSRYDHISQLTTKKSVFHLLWGVRGGPNDQDPSWYQQGRLFWAWQQKKKNSKFSYPVYPESSHDTVHLWVNDLTLGYQTSDSAISSKFHHLALLAMLLALVSHTSNFHNWALLVTLVLHWCDSADFNFAIL